MFIKYTLIYNVQIAAGTDEKGVGGVPFAKFFGWVPPAGYAFNFSIARKGRKYKVESF